MIDSRAIVDPTAKLADNVEVGPFSIIGPDVEIDEGTVIGPHVIVRGPTKLANIIEYFNSRVSARNAKIRSTLESLRHSLLVIIM